MNDKVKVSKNVEKSCEFFSCENMFMKKCDLTKFKSNK